MKSSRPEIFYHIYNMNYRYFCINYIEMVFICYDFNYFSYVVYTCS